MLIDEIYNKNESIEYLKYYSSRMKFPEMQLGDVEEWPLLNGVLNQIFRSKKYTTRL